MNKVVEPKHSSECKSHDETWKKLKKKEIAVEQITEELAEGFIELTEERVESLLGLETVTETQRNIRNLNKVRLEILPDITNGMAKLIKK